MFQALKPIDMRQETLVEDRLAFLAISVQYFRRIPMAKAGARELIRLVSSAGTGYFYTTDKKRGKDKLELKKYDPKVRKHVVFKESKIK